MRKLAITILCIALLLLLGCTQYEVSEGYGLSGAKVTVNTAYPGWSGGAPIKIINGNDANRTFELTPQQPGGSLTNGYEPFPKDYFFWFVVPNYQVNALAGQTIEVPIFLNVPRDVPENMVGKSYDFRILVKDINQTGFVQSAGQAKWLITLTK